MTLWQCRPHDISQRCSSRGCSILMSGRCARLGQAQPLSGLVWTPACAPPETTLPHSQPHHRRMRSTQWDNLSPLLQEDDARRARRRDPSASRCPIWNALGPGGAGWVGVGPPGWGWPCWMGDDEWGSPGGLCEGWQTALWGSPTSLSQAACGRRQQPGPH